jgi:adenylosuccinate synthase
MIVKDYVDAVIGLQYGDEGKGKITAGICDAKNYSLTARYNGGPNAGHTINIDGVTQLKLHQLPSSIAYKKRGYIGPGCVVDFTKLEEEATIFKDIMGFDPYQYLSIDPKAIVITQNHKFIDSLNHAKKGSTSSGIAPAYAEFYNRTAELAGDYTWPDTKGSELIKQWPTIDTLLLEGAQGHYLNPYQGTYPYTTSSSCHPGVAAANFGFPASKIRNIIGVAKCYETRSGYDPEFTSILTSPYSFGKYITPQDSCFNEIYNEIIEVGKEYGVTTGRKRTVRFLDLTRLIKAINETGTTIVVVQKWDILEQVKDSFKLYQEGSMLSFNTVEEMKQYIFDTIDAKCPSVEAIASSASPYNDIPYWSKWL